jgi:hypothetical protein
MTPVLYDQRIIRPWKEMIFFFDLLKIFILEDVKRSPFRPRPKSDRSSGSF